MIFFIIPAHLFVFSSYIQAFAKQAKSLSSFRSQITDIAKLPKGPKTTSFIESIYKSQ